MVPLPHIYIYPSLVLNPEWFKPQDKSVIFLLSKTVIFLGIPSLSNVLWPSYPNYPFPQEYTSPSVVTVVLWYPPQENVKIDLF